MLKLTLIGALIAGLLVFISACTQPATQGEQETSILTTIIFVAAIFVVFYFLMVRPQRKRQKEHGKLVQDLKKGDRVITAGGIYGEIESLDQDTVVLKVESGLLRVARVSIIRRRELT